MNAATAFRSWTAGKSPRLYCNDGLVAQVAREHGMNVSEETVRNSPSTKDEVCRFVGNDIRIQNYCNDTDQGSDHGK